MRKSPNYFHLLRLASALLLSAVLMFSSCQKDDPEPVNEEEVITTVQITLTPDGGGSVITLRFFDPDGDQGSAAPEVIVSGSLQSATSYSAALRFLNETETPAGDVTLEVQEEGSDHLVCFDASSNLTISYADEDDQGRPLGLSTLWLTGDAGPAEVTVSLRHQAGTKTGDCPGSGETDVEVTFNLVVE